MTVLYIMYKVRNRTRASVTVSCRFTMSSVKWQWASIPERMQTQFPSVIPGI